MYFTHESEPARDTRYVWKMTVDAVTQLEAKKRLETSRSNGLVSGPWNINIAVIKAAWFRELRAEANGGQGEGEGGGAGRVFVLRAISLGLARGAPPKPSGAEHAQAFAGPGLQSTGGAARREEAFRGPFRPANATSRRSPTPPATREQKKTRKTLGCLSGNE